MITLVISTTAGATLTAPFWEEAPLGLFPYKLAITLAFRDEGITFPTLATKPEVRIREPTISEVTWLKTLLNKKKSMLDSNKVTQLDLLRN